jgi:4-hydroxythreonine-4-phosphate dehydrogenase
MVSSAPVSAPAPVHAARPRLLIAAGDPAGIGTEVILKALTDSSLAGADLTIVGNCHLLHQHYQHLKPQLISQGEAPEPALADPNTLTILDVPLPTALQEQIQLGVGTAASGEASFQFLETAIAQTLTGNYDGIVTAPIAKSAWKAAGHHYPGQTELLAERAGAERFGMLFVARSPYSGWTLRTLLATTHIPLQQVPVTLSPQLMTRKLELLIACLQQDFGLSQPRIAVAGLNPHSGEQGQLGHEEQMWLIPWLHQMRQRFPQLQLDGPIPPDTLWVRPGLAWYGRDASNSDTGNSDASNSPPAHDAYLALYHDQGLIPVKLMAFDRAVNTTIGLPFVRTSPDHGTAFDIAGQGIAQATSLIAAIQFAMELIQQRSQQQSMDV